MLVMLSIVSDRVAIAEEKDKKFWESVVVAGVVEDEDKVELMDLLIWAAEGSAFFGDL